MRHLLFARLLFMSTAVILLSGCNTLYQDSYQKITVLTPGVENAECILRTETNRYIVMTSREVLVDRSKNPMTITCHKAGYEDGIVEIQPKVYAPYMPLNVYNAIFPGWAYDVASNSIYDYPETVTVKMRADPNRIVVESDKPYMLQKKEEEVRAKPLSLLPLVAEEGEENLSAGKAADESVNKSLRK